MSDFLFSSVRREAGELLRGIREIYRRTAPSIREYHGPWGSLAVSRGHYRGFDPIETDTHICAVIGGPVLCFRDNSLLAGGERDAGTRAVLERILSGQMVWEHDLDGPFVVIVVDKVHARVTSVTDLMMFIPVYEHLDNDGIVLGTHVDAVASVSGKGNAFDEASLVDFILHDVVTYPYTAYQGILQLAPAAEHSYIGLGEGSARKNQPNVYWEPVEGTAFGSIDEAADALRSGLQNYVSRVTQGLDHVAQFISGGEDSRALAGLLPAELKRDAYIFLDNMNREGRIAEKVSAAYGTSFNPRYRSLSYYLDILEDASSLVGLGHQYEHAHALGFHTDCGLTEYPAVFGGYLCDSLLKGVYARKPRIYEKLPFLERVPFLPQFAQSGELRSRPLKSAIFRPDLLGDVECRRRSHLERVSAIRPSTAHEWFVLWPMTMRTAISNFYSTRRLFASYEPFMSHTVVKVSSSVPITWKLNRRLFWRAAQGWLLPARKIRHSDGHYPHHSWLSNLSLHASFWIIRQFKKLIARRAINEGPWGDWETVMRSHSWAEKTNQLKQSRIMKQLTLMSREDDAENFFNSLPRNSQVNAFQIVRSIGTIKPISD